MNFTFPYSINFVAHLLMFIAFISFLSVRFLQVPLCLIGPYRLLLVSTDCYRFNRFLEVSIGSCRFLQVPACFCRFLQIPTGSCRFLQVPAGSYRFPQAFIWSYLYLQIPCRLLNFFYKLPKGSYRLLKVS